jgi:hypothetical protein
MYGFESMTDCTEVTERLTLKDGRWEMIRTYTYADGTTKNFSDEDCFFIVPAAPGWEVEMDSYYDGQATHDRHAITMWKIIPGPHSDQVMPLIAGDDPSIMHALAVISPDGRVFEILRGDFLYNKPFSSIEEWHDHVAKARIARVIEEGKRWLAQEKYPHCSGYGLPFSRPAGSVGPAAPPADDFPGFVKRDSAAEYHQVIAALPVPATTEEYLSRVARLTRVIDDKDKWRAFAQWWNDTRQLRIDFKIPVPIIVALLNELKALRDRKRWPVMQSTRNKGRGRLQERDRMLKSTGRRSKRSGKNLKSRTS